MRSREIVALVDAVEARYGAVSLYGADPLEEHGTCFWIPGAPATMSAHTQDGELPAGMFDIQIEGQPPGDYIFTAVVPLEDVLAFVSRVRGPADDWPLMGGAS